MKFVFDYRSVALIGIAVLMPLLAALGYGTKSPVLNESTCVFLSMFSLFTAGVLLLSSELSLFLSRAVLELYGPRYTIYS